MSTKQKLDTTLHKIYVREKQIINFFENERTIEEAIEFLQRVKENAEKQGFRNVCIEEEISYDCCWFVIRYERLETDKEFQARMKKVKASIRRRSPKKQMDLFLD